MNPTWDKGTRPDMPTVRGLDWLRVAWRGSALVVLILCGLLVLLVARMIERPVCGAGRPVTSRITQFVCRTALRILRITFIVTGTPMTQRGAVVSNHSSWLDIFALNAAKRIYFVSKSEVAGWPGIGLLARATGTVFIERRPAQARAQTQLFQARLLQGHKLLFFPEGTSTDGMEVLPFKTTLFEAFFEKSLRDEIYIQPAALAYRAPQGTDPRFYGWWGGMLLGPHLLSVLATAQPGRIEVVYTAPLKVSDFETRKTLAAACQRAVQAAHTQALARD